VSNTSEQPTKFGLGEKYTGSHPRPLFALPVWAVNDITAAGQ
jgi:hypothetical protein